MFLNTHNIQTAKRNICMVKHIHNTSATIFLHWNYHRIHFRRNYQITSFSILGVNCVTVNYGIATVIISKHYIWRDVTFSHSIYKLNGY